MPLKKGLLFHGPPGTGKSYTVRYLAGSVAGPHDALSSRPSRCGLLPRVHRPWRVSSSPRIVILEDVDLIGRVARGRTAARSCCTSC